MRAILKISKYIIVSAAVTAAAVFAFVESGYFKGLIKSALTDRLQPLTGGSLKVEKLKGNIFTGVELDGVRLAGTGGQFFFAERIDVIYSLPALISGKIHLTRVTIYKPLFAIERNKDGSWSSDGLFSSSSAPVTMAQPQLNRAATSKGTPVIFDEVLVKDGSVSIRHADKPEILKFTSVYLSVAARINGDTADIVINSLSAKGAKPIVTVKSLSGDVKIKGSDISIKGLRIGTQYSRVNIDGTIMAVGNPVFDLNIDCPEVSLKEIGDLVPGIRPAGVLSSSIKVTGGFDSLKVVQSLDYNSLKVHNEAVVRFGTPAISLSSKIRGLKPCEIIPVFAGYETKDCPQGNISMDIRAQAEGSNFDALQSSVSIGIQPSSFAGLNFGESSIAATIRKRTVSVEGALELAGERYILSILCKAGEKALMLTNLKVKSADLSLSSSGAVDYGSSGPLDIVFNLKSANLGVISAFVPSEKVGGSVSSTGTIKGSLNSPILSADIEGSYLSFSGFSANSVKAKIALEGFKMPPDGAAEARVSGFRSGAMVFDKIYLKARKSKNSGSIELSADKSPSVKLAAGAVFAAKSKGVYLVDINKFNVSSGTAAWSNEGDIKAEVSEGQLRIESLRISSGGQLISAQGDIGRERKLGLQVNVKNAGLESLGAMAGFSSPIGGALSADITIGGSYLAPLISGAIDINGALADGLPFEKIPVTIKYAEKKLRFESRIEYKGKILFSAKGVVPVDLSLGPVKGRFADKDLRVSIKSSGLGLDMLPALTKQVISAKGMIQADILVEGDPMSPSMHGNIDISSGSLTLLATQTEYSDINARIELQGDNALVHRLVMKSGGGSAEVTGKIALKDFTPVDAELALKCRGFKVMSTNIFTGSIDSDIKIKGLSASGKVTVTQGIVNIPSQSKAEANEIEYVKTGPGGRNIPVPAAVTPDIYKMLVLDVRLLAPEKTWVYGQGISAEIRADLNVTKQRDEPLSYDGAIEVIRGTYKISERTLTISEGKLVTRGSNIMDSLISAKASCKLTDVSIDVLVGGTLNKLMINFQSDPPMERADIISYLAFGAPSSKLSMSQSSAVKGSSYGILAGFAEKDIKSAVNRVVPIDELTIQPSEGSWGVGKNITDKLTAKYEWRSAEDERPQTVLDYRLDRHFSLDSLMGDPLTSGVDLFWKLGY